MRPLCWPPVSQHPLESLPSTYPSCRPPPPAQIAKRITELLGGLEDDVLIAYVIEQLEGKKVGSREAGR